MEFPSALIVWPRRANPLPSHGQGGGPEGRKWTEISLSKDGKRKEAKYILSDRLWFVDS
jgi:hypothetical protein